MLEHLHAKAVSMAIIWNNPHALNARHNAQFVRVTKSVHLVNQGFIDQVQTA
jgi:hypothetical protein